MQASAQVPYIIWQTYQACFELSYQIILRSTDTTTLDNRNIYVTFIMLLRESVVSVPCRLHLHQNMLHKIAQYVTAQFVDLLRSHKVIKTF